MQQVLPLYCANFNPPIRTIFQAGFVASKSLVFIQYLIDNIEDTLVKLLPAIERSKLSSKMFIELPKVLVEMELLLRRSSP